MAKIGVLVQRRPTKKVNQQQKSQLKHKLAFLRILQEVSPGHRSLVQRNTPLDPRSPLRYANVVSARWGVG
jgi:hypothetical protein